MKPDMKTIQTLVNLVKEAELTELTIESKGSKISIKRGYSGQVYVESPEEIYPPETALIPEEELKNRGLPESVVAIRAPRVGILHWNISPEGTPLVSLGDKLERGQVIGAVEAMNFMDEIYSEVSGKVSEILVEEGQPVEYGQEIMLVKSVKTRVEDTK